MSEVLHKLDLFGQAFGPYHIGKKIGEGGYAVVFRATEVELERDVALKVLKPNARGEYGDTVKKRFMREARMVANLKSEHTVQLYAHGEEDGLLFLAFEFVEGETLAAYLRREGALPPLQVVKLLEQILEALEEAHSRGLIHRDIKPANIMVFAHNRRGLQAKVLDFGIGKFIRDQQKLTQLTAEGRLIGTPRYMSPEQMYQAEGLGPGVDIWAVGMIAYELLVGKRAIASTDPMEVTSRILNDSAFKLPPDAGVPQFLREIVEKMLRKDVAKRYQSTSDILRDLENFRMRASHDSSPKLLPGTPTAGEIYPFVEETEEQFSRDASVTRLSSVPTASPDAQYAAASARLLEPPVEKRTSTDGMSVKPSEAQRVSGKLWGGIAAIVAALLGVAWLIASLNEPSAKVAAVTPETLLSAAQPSQVIASGTNAQPAHSDALPQVYQIARSEVQAASIAARAVSAQSSVRTKNKLVPDTVGATKALPRRTQPPSHLADHPRPVEPSGRDKVASKTARPESTTNSTKPEHVEPGLESAPLPDEVPPKSTKQSKKKLRVWGI